MDLRSLTAKIAAQAPASVETARRLTIELARAQPPAPFAGALSPGSFHVDLATAFGSPAARGAAGAVKLPFTVVFQPSFKARG